MYQPEKDAQTGESIHQREDHNHLLKRIIASLREGNIPGIDLRFMRDALHDPSTGLDIFGWVDKRCKQATGYNGKVFGGNL